jgi:hypothetical protein
VEGSILDFLRPVLPVGPALSLFFMPRVSEHSELKRLGFLGNNARDKENATPILVKISNMSLNEK